MTEKTIERIAEELWYCAVTHDPKATVLGNVTVAELRRLCAVATAMCSSCARNTRSAVKVDTW